ncbi:MAG: hypothetical protein K8R57_08015 [Verrucomicrobia bacterium]|nr:hypothetical protein [Verrucomicrobiota bacterium]
MIGSPTSRILAIKLDHIGDFALALPALSAVALQAKLHVVVSELNLGWREVCPWIEEFHVVQFPGYQTGRQKKRSRIITALSLLKLTWKLRKYDFDYAVDLRTVPDDWRGKLIALLSGARHRIGAIGVGDAMLTLSLADNSQHESDRILDRIRAIYPGIIVPPAPWVQVLRKRPRSSHALVLLHPGSGFSSKLWPDNFWRDLVNILASTDPSIELRWLGGVSDRDRISAINAILPTGISSCISASISESLQEIADADLLLGLDSAAPHMAATVGTPAITIFSSANEPSRWKALGDNSIATSHVSCSPCKLKECNQKTHACMENIRPEEVAGLVINKLNKLSLHAS